MSFSKEEDLGFKNKNYRKQMKRLIKNVLNNLDQDSAEDPQFRWEYLNMK